MDKSADATEHSSEKVFCPSLPLSLVPEPSIAKSNQVFNSLSSCLLLNVLLYFFLQLQNRKYTNDSRFDASLW